ncbi:MAG: SGNH/GDSL hydrolase family protein [Lachnospiraceae bacterium]|nr:SGNH/GDSL hydrolase family protein [Lachnospiraceae bacterium]
MAQKQSRRKRHRSEFAFVIKLLLMVLLVIFIFEGRLIYTMFTFDSSGRVVSSENEEKAGEDGTDPMDQETEEETESGAASGTGTAWNSYGAYLAGLSDAGLTGEVEEVKEPHDTVSNPDSTAIVREQEEAVDDAYFSDAVFIGDSRMEGFRNTSGITEGTFFTSVGMSLDSMTSEKIISDGTDTMTVAAALSGGTYGKIYIMLGANDLGEYSWDDFKTGFVSVTGRFLEIQPDAVLYICSCIYVEEDKVTTGDYINNENVDQLNEVLLEVCEEQGYYYLDLNEELSDGYGSLISGASEDGVHLAAEYCKKMLDYLKTHYVNAEDTDTEHETETETG